MTHQQLTIGIDATPATRAVKTGTEQYAESLILALAALKTEHQFILYSRFAPTGALSQLPANFHWEVMPFPILWSQLRLAYEFLIHPTAVDVMFFPAHIMPLVHPKRTVITLHDIGFEHFPELYARFPIGPSFPPLRWLISLGVWLFTGGRYRNTELDYHRWATRFALQQATTILTVSEATKRDVETHFSPHNELIVTHQAVHPGDQQFLAGRPQRPLPAVVRARQPYLLFVGRIEAKKNVVTLVRAFAQLAIRESTLQLVLVGRPGHGYAAVADAIATFPAAIQARIHELGYQPRRRTLQWLQGATIFAFPSAFEGFGVPPLEAMAAGVPVVASNSTSIPEVVGAAARLVTPNDTQAWTRALRELLHQPTLRARLVRAGRQRLKKFSWHSTASRTLEALEQAARWDQTHD